jgi:glycosyltransferase involved in cell wall biosynthesis
MVGAVFLSIFDWAYHSHGHSDFQLARAFARRTPVVFVNSIGMRAPNARHTTAPLRRVGRKLASMARRRSTPASGENVTAISTVFAPVYGGLLGRANQNIVRRQIAGHLKKAAMARPVLIVTCPTFVPVARSMDRSALIYNRSDNHSAFPGVDRALIDGYVDQLLRASDLVLYANDDLFERERSLVGERGCLIGHGVDTVSFSPDGPRSAELEALPRPRVGFFGDLRVRALDIDLIASAAAALPDVAFVLGGTQLDDLSALRALPNVRLLGNCPHNEMPARWRSLDVAMLPYKRGPWLDVIQPIKLNEILATGLPIVATPLPALRRQPELVRITEGPVAFAAAVRAALDTGGVSELAARTDRRARARLSSWDAITDRIVASAGVDLP